MDTSLLSFFSSPPPANKCAPPAERAEIISYWCLFLGGYRFHVFFYQIKGVVLEKEKKKSIQGSDVVCLTFSSLGARIGKVRKTNDGVWSWWTFIMKDHVTFTGGLGFRCLRSEQRHKDGQTELVSVWSWYLCGKKRKSQAGMVVMFTDDISGLEASWSCSSRLVFEEEKLRYIVHTFINRQLCPFCLCVWTINSTNPLKLFFLPVGEISSLGHRKFESGSCRVSQTCPFLARDSSCLSSCRGLRWINEQDAWLSVTAMHDISPAILLHFDSSSSLNFSCALVASVGGCLFYHRAESLAHQVWLWCIFACFVLLLITGFVDMRKHTSPKLVLGFV